MYIIVLLKLLFPKKILPELAETGEVDHSPYKISLKCFFSCNASPLVCAPPVSLGISTSKVPSEVTRFPL